MRSRALVFASLVLLVAPLSVPTRHGCRHRHRHAPAAPLVAPESPLERLAR
jgi:hypothetical protein